MTSDECFPVDIKMKREVRNPCVKSDLPQFIGSKTTTSPQNNKNVKPCHNQATEFPQSSVRLSR